MKCITKAIAVLFFFSTGIAMAQGEPSGPVAPGVGTTGSSSVIQGPVVEGGVQMAPPTNPASVESLLVGSWTGPWSSHYSDGGMDLEIHSIRNDAVSGRIKASYSYNGGGCSTEWVPFTGTFRERSLVLRYDLGGRCERVTSTLRVDPAGKLMLGNWASSGSGGKMQLTKSSGSSQSVAEVQR